MQKMLAKFKQTFLVHSISFLFASLSWIKNDTLFRWFYTLLSFLAEKLAKKDYYVEKIRWIKGLFDNNHPSLAVTKNIAGHKSALPQDTY